MPTMICKRCGTRNPEDASLCRRCKQSLATANSPATVPLTPGDVPRNLVLRDRWRIEEAIPDSYGAHLFIGRDTTTGRTVLIKRLGHLAARDRAVRSRFLNEAELLQRLDHPNVVRVIDVVEDGDIPAIVMGYPSGEPMTTLLQRLERIPLSVTITFALQIIDALDYIHRQGVTHRNLRPANIFVGPNPKTGLPHLTLIDYGIAGTSRTASESSDQTGTLMGMRVGDTSLPVIPSPYVAPELLHDRSDARTDIYSLGVVLFEMLTGRPALATGADDTDSLIAAITEERPTLLRLLRPEAPSAFGEVIERMMSKDPGDRFLDVAQARLALMSAEVEPMVAVERGPFLRGSRADDENGRDEERPIREVDLDAFYIDRNLVTVGQFRKFAASSQTALPAEWERHNQIADRPVVYVTWDEALAYAEWAGKRLPTEAEWEKAARGTDGRTYPWGEEDPDDTRAVFGGRDSVEPVGRRPSGGSPYGALDMAGNAFEWVADWYGRDYYAEADDENPTGPASGSKKVLRGGSFVHKPFALRCATRGRYAPAERRANHSFRCAWSLE